MPEEEHSMNCPSCFSENIKKNGHIHNKKQNYRCKDCGRQFVTDRTLPEIKGDTKEDVRKLLLERISLRGICRVTGVSLSWLLFFFRKITSEIPEDMGIIKRYRGRITIEIDEMWSFVSRRGSKIWVWLAVDRETGQIVGFHVGGRGTGDARRLWASLPGVYRRCAVCYTDFWEAYNKVIPGCRHRAVGKETGQTNHVERCNCTLRQRVSRLVRETLSFSKKITNHILAIKYFIWHYNTRKRTENQLMNPV